MAGAVQPGLTESSAPVCAEIATLDSPAKKWTTCALCGESLSVVVDERVAFPDYWHLHVFHNHGTVPPIWEAALFYRVKGGRYTEEAKRIEILRKEQKKVATAAKQKKTSKRKAPAFCGTCGQPIELERLPYTHPCGRKLSKGT